MAGNGTVEKSDSDRALSLAKVVKNSNIEDRRFTAILENLAVIFYYKKPQESFYYKELEFQDSFQVLLAYLKGMSMNVLRMSTKEFSPEEIVRTIVDAVKNNPGIFYVVPIVYRSTDEKEAIMWGIWEGLTLKENEESTNEKKKTVGTLSNLLRT